jgi:hypothetical protein
MRIILVLLSILVSSTALASGKVSIEPRYLIKDKKVGAALGLSIYQKIVGPLAVNIYAGTGFDPSQDGVDNWVSAKADIELQFQKLTVALGAKGEADVDPLFCEPSVYAKVAYQIW